MGLGQMGKIWLDVLLSNPLVNVIALVDINIDSAKQAATSHNLSESIVFETLTQALEAKLNPQVVVDITPPFIRSKIVTEALEYGLNVLSEKPMGMTKDDLDTICEIADKNNSLYMISQNYRWSSGATAIREIVKSGKLGRILKIDINFSGNESFKDFRANLENPLLIDMAIHHFDLIRYFTGSNCKSVLCKEFNPEGSTFKQNAAAFASIEMEQGEMVVYNGNWASQNTITYYSGYWLIQGEFGLLTWDGGYRIVTLIDNNISIIDIEKEKEDKLATSLSHFINAIETSTAPETTYKDNIHTMNMVLAAIKSSKNDSKINI